MSTVRQLGAKDKVCEQIDVPLLADIYPREVIEACVGGSAQWQSKRRRVRQSTLVGLVWLLIAMALWSRESQRRVWLKLTGVLRDLHLGTAEAPLSASAISNRRMALGADGMHQLVQTCCRPLATRDALPEAFFGRYRLMAIDGTLFVTPDTAANEEAFGRCSNQFGKGAYPHVRCVVLCECGSHAIVGVERSRYDVSEVHGAHQLLSQVGADTLVLVDAGITSGGFVEHVRARGAHLLAALEAGAWETPEVRRLLPDGSVLAWIPASSSRVCYPTRHGFWIRILAYQLTDERLGEPEKQYRLVTTLLNPRVAPASELIGVYHERWEVELVLDEIKTHQRAQKRSCVPKHLWGFCKNWMACSWPTTPFAPAWPVPLLASTWIRIVSPLPRASFMCVNSSVSPSSWRAKGSTAGCMSGCIGASRISYCPNAPCASIGGRSNKSTPSTNRRNGTFLPLNPFCLMSSFSTSSC